MSDALTSLRSALSPKTGMRRIPFPVESYQHPSVPLTAKRLINLFIEGLPNDARTQAALLSTPGLAVDQIIGDGPILAMNSDMPGRLYVVSGSHFYRVHYPTLVVDDLGDIGSPGLDEAGGDTLMVTIAAGPTAAVVCVPPNAFTCAHEGILNPIGGAFPGATSVAYLDGYFAFTATGDSARFFISRLLDPTDFDALDFAYSDGLPNVLRRVIPHLGELWLMGEAGHEVWYNAGLADFPFRRRSGGVIPRGATTPKTIAVGDASVWWIGTDNIVYRSKGYQPVRVSTHAVEAVIDLHGGGSAAWGMVYTQGGHTFYTVTVYARTLVYDGLTQVWAERSSTTNGVGRWRPNAVSAGTNTLLFGDSITGKLFTAVPGLATENGDLVIRQATLPPIWGGTHRAFCHRLEIEMETGGALTPGAVLLEWSNDGGRTWGPSRTMTAGLLAELRHRVFTTRLGSFRERVFRITTHGVTTLYAVDADISPGEGG